MVKKSKLGDINFILETAVLGIQEKKGNNVVCLDLRDVEGAAADCFVVCDADSYVQIQAIANSVEKEVFEAFGEVPWRREGTRCGEWILLDYVNVVVHIFKKDKRIHYDMEALWGDAAFYTA